MNIKDKQELCGRALISWILHEKEGVKKHNEALIKDSFISKVILQKFEAFHINIFVPDELLIILEVCTEANPGQSQVILKDLLNYIKIRKGPIPKGYVITSEDASLYFMSEFPITEIKHINDKYQKLWDDQKKERNGAFDSDNKCDTPEYWLEVME